MGPIAFDIRALERSVRSKRILKGAIANNYLKGLSTQKVSAFKEALFGFSVSSAQAGGASQLLNDAFEHFRIRRLDEDATPLPFQ